jgi:mannose-1-phosphate guanylyltransferase
MLYSTILAGGSGTRLWPLSRAGEPKFLHPLTGTDRTLLQATVDRTAGLSEPDTVYVVTGAAHAAAIARQLPQVPVANILVEPSPRDSCAAIGLAAAVIARRDPDAIMAAFSADHLIGDEAEFISVIRQAEAAARHGYLTTVGIRPAHADVRFGYLRTGPRLVPEAQAGDARMVAEFREKPSLAVAREYLESGQYLWNAGIFVFGVKAFLGELERQKPELHAGIAAIAAAWETPEREHVLEQIWPGLEKVSVDYGVMEGAAAAGRVATVPAGMPWSDVGDFHSLGEALATDESGNLLIAATDQQIITRDVKDAVVVSTTGRVVALIGLANVVVVDTPDAILVCARDRAQEVKQVVDELRDRGAGSCI